MKNPFDQRDEEIDNIFWEEVAGSEAPSDYSVYISHYRHRAPHFEKAMHRVSECVNNPDPGPLAFVRAITRIRRLAEAGDAAAMFHMGKVYANGFGVAQDLEQAEKWYQMGVDAGELRSICNLGWLYETGFGIRPPDKEKAFALLSRAAPDSAHALASVGLMLIAGKGCQPDPARGLASLEAAFINGCTEAGNHLADAYFAARNAEEGLAWLERVAERGNARTMAILGHHLVTGFHGKTDAEKGIKLLESAAAKAYLPAYRWLGSLYQRGNGVAKDDERARGWYQQGADLGDIECLSLLMAMPPQGGVNNNSGPSRLH